MQSRLAMSGLSLCLITITLLWISVVTRRRRIMLAASHFERMANERLLREQQRQLCERRAVAIQIPRTSRSRAVCEFRHFVQAARNADVRLVTGACGLHSPRYLITADISTRIHAPPPGKCRCVGWKKLPFTPGSRVHLMVLMCTAV
uniref:Secreted protein n=1 Tax=Parascaris univalens TaxID=6257 RepID=A0A914ZXP8_PARUN